MTTTTTPSRVDGGDIAPLRMPTLGWALRRVALGILILVFSVTGSAFLLYASIDPTEEERPSSATSGPEASPVSTAPAPSDPSKRG